MSKRISIFLDEQEEKNLNTLIGKYGGRAPAYFRFLLKEAFEREYGGYKSGKFSKILGIPEEEVTDAQFCESNGGKVAHREGFEVCLLEINESSSISVPLSNRNRIKDLAKQYKLIPP